MKKKRWSFIDLIRERIMEHWSDLGFRLYLLETTSILAGGMFRKVSVTFSVVDFCRCRTGGQGQYEVQVFTDRDRDYQDLMHAIHRRNDTFYVVSFRRVSPRNWWGVHAWLVCILVSDVDDRNLIFWDTDSEIHRATNKATSTARVRMKHVASMIAV